MSSAAPFSVMRATSAPARRVGHVRGEVEVGEVGDPREDLLDALALGDRGRKLRGERPATFPW